MHSRQITFSVDEGEGRYALIQLLDEFEGSEGGGGGGGKRESLF